MTNLCVACVRVGVLGSFKYLIFFLPARGWRGGHRTLEKPSFSPRSVHYGNHEVGKMEPWIIHGSGKGRCDQYRAPNTNTEPLKSHRLILGSLSYNDCRLRDVNQRDATSGIIPLVMPSNIRFGRSAPWFSYLAYLPIACGLGWEPRTGLGIKRAPICRHPASSGIIAWRRKKEKNSTNELWFARSFLFVRFFFSLWLCS